MFKLSYRQVQKFDQWKLIHNNTCEFATKPGKEETVGRWTYSFTPTNNAPEMTIKCKCGDEIDVTDRDKL